MGWRSFVKRGGKSSKVRSFDMVHTKLLVELLQENTTSRMERLEFAFRGIKKNDLNINYTHVLKEITVNSVGDEVNPPIEDLDILEKLLDQGGTDLLACNDSGYNVLQWLCSLKVDRSKTTQLERIIVKAIENHVQMSLKGKKDLSIEDINDTLSALISSKDRLSSRDPFTSAIIAGNYSIAKIFMNSGYD